MQDSKIKNMEAFASVSGISRPTVSKYFNDPDSVRASTRARIEAALERYDYRPNIYAMNQNRKLTKNVGIIVPFMADPVFAELARITEQLCVAAGYRPTLFSSHGEPAHELDILETVLSMKPAGLLIAPLGRASDKEAIARFSAEVPTVLFDSNITDVDLTFVGSDNAQFTDLAVEYLCRTGPPPCFFEMKTPPNPNANKRRLGYIEAMKRLGHAAQVIAVEGSGWAFEEFGRLGGLKALDEGLFESGSVLCSNDRLAIGLLSACYEQGVKVGTAPDCGLRVAGQDDHPFSRYTCPSLTTIAYDYEAVSSRAVEALFAIIEGGTPPPKSTLLEGRLIMRGSA